MRQKVRWTAIQRYMVDAGARSGRLYHNDQKAAHGREHQVPEHEFGVEHAAVVGRITARNI